MYMKLKYGYAKFCQTLKYEDGRIFGNVGDVMMFCRQDIKTMSLVLTENENQYRCINIIPEKNFNRFFKVINCINLLCTEGIRTSNMIFNEGTVYQFKNHLFQSLNSIDQPWVSDIGIIGKDEIWDTALFFQQGFWLRFGKFKS